MQPTSWHNQDILHLSVGQWIKALKDPSIFNDEALQLVRFVYSQNKHESTASDIANSFSASTGKVHYNKICACNRKVAKALYSKYNVEPPVEEDGEHRFWNIIFDGNADSPLDSNGHFYWRLRPNLITALENQGLVSKIEL
jgi:hypothetical protein